MEKREIELKLVEKFSSRNLDPDKMFRVSNRDVRYFFFTFSQYNTEFCGPCP